MNEDRTAKLWDFVYGLLDEAEAAQLRVQICSDRELAKEYARVKLKSELVAAAAKAAQCDCEPIGLPQAFRIPASKGRSAASRAWSAAGTLALSLALVLFMGYVYLQEGSPVRTSVALQSVEELAAAHPRLLVVGPSELTRGQLAEYQVMLQNPADESPLTLPVTAQLETREGKVAWEDQGVTDQDGTHRFYLPDSLEADAYRFRVTVDGKDRREEARPEGAKPAELTTWLRASDPAPTFAWSEQVRTVDGEVLQSQVYYAARDKSRASEIEGVSKVGGKVAKKQFVDGDEQLSAVGKGAALSYDVAKMEKANARFFESKSPARYSETAERPTSGDDALVMRDALPTKNAEDAPGTSPAGAAVSEANKLPEPAATPAGTPRQDEATLNAPAAPQNETYTTQPEREQAPLLVEALWDENGNMQTRLVERDRAKSVRSSQRSGEVRKDLADTSSETETKKNGVLIDYSQAPPQPVERYSSLSDNDLAADKLALQINFDRPAYYPGDQVVVEVKVTDRLGAAVPAVLGVEVEAVPAEVADEPFNILPAAERTSPVNHPLTAEMPLPLLYDNVAQQHARLAELSNAYLAERQLARQRAASGLLIGSGLGMVVLALLAGLRRLPRAKIWVPSAVLLALCVVVAVMWMTTREQVPLSSPTPLATFGVQSQLPVPDEPRQLVLVEGTEVVAKEAPLLRAGGGGGGSFSGTLEAVQEEDARSSLPQASDLALSARTMNHDSKTVDLGLKMADQGRHRRPAGAVVESLALDSLAESKPNAKTPSATFEEGNQLSGALFWQPALQLPQTGTSTFDFYLPDLPVAYRVIVRARHRGNSGFAWQFVPAHVPRF